VLALAAGPDEALRATALAYFLEHFAKHYSAYRAADFAALAFVPTAAGALARPTDVVAQPEWAALGFAVVAPAVRDAALTKMGVREHPAPGALIEALKVRAPTTEEDARVWFEALAPRLGCTCWLRR
jgi:hypothetical protein